MAAHHHARTFIAKTEQISQSSIPILNTQINILMKNMQGGFNAVQPPQFP